MSAWEAFTLLAGVSWLCISVLAARRFWRVDRFMTILVVMACVRYAFDLLTRGIAS